MSCLHEKHCQPCTGATPPLKAERVAALLSSLVGWQSDGTCISKTVEFKNYYRTMAFVNAVAFIAHREDHHPDLLVSYNRCTITYTTHAVGGLSENDFICAAKVDGLLSG